MHPNSPNSTPISLFYNNNHPINSRYPPIINQIAQFPLMIEQTNEPFFDIKKEGKNDNLFPFICTSFLEQNNYFNNLNQKYEEKVMKYSKNNQKNAQNCCFYEYFYSIVDEIYFLHHNEFIEYIREIGFPLSTVFIYFN